eukprot:CAMPEP_0171986046 /NCGR_PEP_ID=MMETSP0993-20121228/274669_1 /TAXON_ID=483369 /ORGANISM="non described non described, Strain CCMP2098" /LENGTH=174 /DNA_ID=CAMNT_0012638943 /DNA_START=39 /DNA_END=560 /DNA_ORIENTATION=+
MTTQHQVQGEIVANDYDEGDKNKTITVEAQMTNVQNPQVVQAQPMVAQGVALTPATQMMNVQIPPGISPGMTMIVQSPQGAQFQVVVPQGVSSGATIQVQVPHQVVTSAPQIMNVPGQKKGVSSGATIQVQVPHQVVTSAPQIMNVPGQKTVAQNYVPKRAKMIQQPYCGPKSW